MQRARQLARTGRVPAHREGRAWAIDETAIAPTTGRTRRPLAPQTREALIRFFDTRNLDHVTGMPKQRLTKVIRNLKRAENPSVLLRDYFAGAAVPEGHGGAAIVRAALKGNDRDANLAVRMGRHHTITSLEQLATRARDARMLAGLSLDEAAERAALPPEQIRGLERGDPASYRPLSVHRLARVIDMNISVLRISLDG